MTQYIGDVKIKKVKTYEDDDRVKLIFADDNEITMDKSLFASLASTEKGQGNITDNTNAYFARKFLAELAQYDLDYYMIDSVATSMRVLAHNLREELIRKTFKCSGGDAISLKKLLK